MLNKLGNKRKCNRITLLKNKILVGLCEAGHSSFQYTFKKYCTNNNRLFKS